MDWLQEKVEREEPLDRREALSVLEASQGQLPAVFEAATRARRRVFGDGVTLCSIVNARSGACGEDCVFCAQSVHHGTGTKTYPLISSGTIDKAYRDASRLPIMHFGVVTSGRSLGSAERARVCEAIERNEGCGAAWCASLGESDEAALAQLKAAGLSRYHHNLETAESYFPSICTTHTYADRARTVRAAKRAGLEVCSGGIFGLGETREQRVELAFALRELDVDSVPLNFLVPIPGTPTADARPLSEAEILKTIAMFRFVCRRAQIKVCAGREAHLGANQKMIFAAGATGMMTGGYLTVSGATVEEDLAMIEEAGMRL